MWCGVVWCGAVDSRAHNCLCSCPQCLCSCPQSSSPFPSSSSLYSTCRRQQSKKILHKIHNPDYTHQSYTVSNPHQLLIHCQSLPAAKKKNPFTPKAALTFFSPIISHHPHSTHPQNPNKDHLISRPRRPIGHHHHAYALGGDAIQRPARRFTKVFSRDFFILSLSVSGVRRDGRDSLWSPCFCLCVCLRRRVHKRHARARCITGCFGRLGVRCGV